MRQVEVTTVRGNYPMQVWLRALDSLELPTLPLQSGRSPSLAVCSSIFEQLSSLANRSSIMDTMGQYMREIGPLWMASWIKWNHTSMCFVLAWCYLSLDNGMAD